jgi:hypothetical protein
VICLGCGAVYGIAELETESFFDLKRWMDLQCDNCEKGWFQLAAVEKRDPETRELTWWLRAECTACKREHEYVNDYRAFSGYGTRKPIIIPVKPRP